MKKLRLKGKEERRFKMGHPWVFSNELQEVPKNLEAGEVVELDAASGDFLAYGFVNPHSLISFRELTREENSYKFESGKIPCDLFKDAFFEAHSFRANWFSNEQSCRFVFGEADGLPGLIIDRFVGDPKTEKFKIAFVVQPHSAGMDRALPEILEALSQFVDSQYQEYEAVAILRRDAGSREREGLTKEKTILVNLKTGKELESSDPFRHFRFVVPAVMGRSIVLGADLVSGQKTGFFFDQLQNIRLLETLLLRKIRHAKDKSGVFRVLDLCSYVGQWGVHLIHTLNERGRLPIDYTLVDASDGALKLAEMNMTDFALDLGVASLVKIKAIKADVLDPMPYLNQDGYEVVIADPPAFIKNRKSIPQGKQAYAALFEAAIRATAKGGLVVCCSCSQLLSHEDFLEVLTKASRRSKRKVRWIAAGSPSFDHYQRFEFQEGSYLKSYIAQVD